MKKIPPFYITRTLMGFGPGPDLNRIFLNMPGDQKVILRDMGAPRTDAEIRLWNELAQKLSEVWEGFDERGRRDAAKGTPDQEGPSISTQRGS